MGSRLVLAIAMLAPLVARADDARAHFETGQRAYDAHDYGTAAREFARAHELTHATALLYSWAQAERLGGHCEAAIELYRRYLAEPNISTASSELAHQWIDVCEAALPAPWYRDPLFVGLAAGGLVGIAAGTAFLVRSGSTADAASRAPTLDAHDALVDDASRQRTIGGIALSLGIAAAGAAVVVFLVRHDADGPVVTTDGRVAAIGGRF